MHYSCASVLSNVLALISVIVLTACSTRGPASEDSSKGTNKGLHLGAGNRIKQVSVLYFDFNSAAIRFGPTEIIDQTPELDAVVSWLAKNPLIRIRLEGHCDEREGAPQEKQALCERRARFVRDCLVIRGVSTSRLTILSYGDSRPAVRGVNELAWAQNRRVEFAVAED